MDILIESTRDFEKDLTQLGEDDRTISIQKVNDCVSLFPAQKSEVYRKLRYLRPVLNLNGYDSSLYVLRVSQKIRVSLAIDEDPIFEQIIFTLFRAVSHAELGKAYQDVAASLYRDVLHDHQEAVKIP
jgi:hypothetical protein